MKKCENCFWFDQCDQEELCEDYCPLYDEDIEAELEEEYKEELRSRHRLYMYQVEEQDD